MMPASGSLTGIAPDWLACLVIWLLLIDGLAVILMGVDKSKARQGRWRIPEKTLFSIAFIGGSAGILAGMWLFRHKTRHQSFTWGIPAILLVQAGLIAAVLFF